MGTDDTATDASEPGSMRRITGIGVSRGVAVGRVVRLPDPVPEPLARHIVDSEAESALIPVAVRQVVAELEARAARAHGEGQEVLEATVMMVSDPQLSADAQTVVLAESTTAARAFWVTATRYAEMLEAAGGYLGARARDVLDVRDRVVAALLGVPVPEVPSDGEPYILVAHDLAPADTAVLPLDKVLALITSGGGPTSHTAIIARAMNLPAVVACPMADSLVEGEVVIVDGASGAVVVDPDDELVARAREKSALRRTARVVPPVHTSDGVEVHLFANVGNGADARAARDIGATGIGLFRTELLYLDRAVPPTIDEQIQAYTEVFEAFADRKVVVRTLDAGADKPLPFLDFGHEWNPALGVRGLRTSTSRAEVLTDQLHAIAAAATQSSADVWVMAPMVATAQETQSFAALVRAAGLKTAGIMVEIPSAAVMAEHLLARCDFVSIGTNDLCQYVHAADRQSSDLAAFNDPWQPGLLALIRMTVEAGKRTGKPVGVCGEAAADPLLACVLLGMGVSSLSMSAAALPDVAGLIARVDSRLMAQAAAAVLAAGDIADARAAAQDLLPDIDDSFV
jgi:phosphoenolpyruvate-protein phosphotransferase (PTS system enzyme I)